MEGLKRGLVDPRFLVMGGSQTRDVALERTASLATRRSVLRNAGCVVEHIRKQSVLLQVEAKALLWTVRQRPEHRP